MLKLCAKDFVASRWLWLLVLAFDIVCFRAPSNGFLLFMISGVVLVIGCVFLTLFLEYRFKTDIFYASLPLRRSTIAGARYMLAGILAIFSIAWTSAYGCFLNSVVWPRSYRIDLKLLFSVEGIAGYLFFMAFLAALFFPLYFKYGLALGSFVFAAVCLALGSLVLVFQFLATDKLHLTGPLSMPKFFKDPGLGILRAVGGIKTSLGVPLFIGALLVLMAGMTFVSIRLSVRLYEKREF